MDDNPRRIVIGSFEADTVAIPAAVFERANAALDSQAEQRRRRAEAATADAMRVKATRRARAMRRFKQALTLLRGGVR